MLVYLYTTIDIKIDIDIIFFLNLLSGKYGFLGSSGGTYGGLGGVGYSQITPGNLVRNTTRVGYGDFFSAALWGSPGSKLKFSSFEFFCFFLSICCFCNFHRSVLGLFLFTFVYFCL